MAKRDYLVDAAKQIRMALDREVSEDYQAAFNYYKNGVDLLLSGVQGTMAQETTTHLHGNTCFCKIHSRVGPVQAKHGKMLVRIRFK